MKTIFTFTLLMMTVSATAGERIGNGGDIRRFRSMRAKYAVSNVFSELTVRPLCAPLQGVENDWFLNNANQLWKDVLKIQTFWNVWTDPQNACAIAYRGPNAKLAIRFNYLTCPKRTDDNFYPRTIARLFLQKYFSPDRIKGAMITFDNARALAQKCKSARDANTDYSPNTGIISDSDLMNPDAMLKHIQNAKKFAVLSIRKHSPQELSQLYAGAYGQWLVANWSVLQEDILKSQVNFETKYHSCGYTLRQRNSPISISIPDCQDIHWETELAWLLIHESVHHLGMQPLSLDSLVGLLFEYHYTIK